LRKAVRTKIAAPVRDVAESSVSVDGVVDARSVDGHDQVLGPDAWRQPIKDLVLEIEDHPVGMTLLFILSLAACHGPRVPGRASRSGTILMVRLVEGGSALPTRRCPRRLAAWEIAAHLHTDGMNESGL